MKSAKVFLIGKDQEHLIPMTETEYPQEDKLQELIARYHDLLPGDQMDPDDPPRWLLVGREIGIPGDVNEASKWSLDHLFIDHNGIPTFVECKRSSDTRARREVVAQMLDYAANGTAYWSIDQLLKAATETAKRRGKSVEDEIIELLQSSDEPELVVKTFWQTVESNLHTGKVRLIFVADDTSKELRRLVEFLNDKMADVEVLAVEIKQFLSDNHKVLVPRVIGSTEAARERKDGGRRRKNLTNRHDFLSKLNDPAAVKFFERMLDLAEQFNFTINWGEVGFSLRTYLPKANRLSTFAFGWPTSIFNFYFNLPISETEASTLRNELMGFQIFEEAGEKKLRATVNKETASSLNQALDCILERVKTISSSH